MLVGGTSKSTSQHIITEKFYLKNNNRFPLSLGT